MGETSATALASAADTRRCELPATVALAILIGGLAAAIMGGAGGVLWAAIMAVLLIADAELYRRLDVAEAKLEGRLGLALTFWALFTSSIYAALPIALWLHGEAAGAAAAMVLWIAGVVRHFNGGSGRLSLTLAGAAPPALSLICTPIVVAATGVRADWDLAVIAVIGGGALMAYLAHARLSALRGGADEDMQHALARLLFEQRELGAFLLDREGRILAMSDTVRKSLKLENSIGKKFEESCPWASPRWREACQHALAGESVHRDEDSVLGPNGLRWFQWSARPWRDAHGAIRGTLTFTSDVTNLVLARKSAAENEQRLLAALETGRSVVLAADAKLRNKRALNDGERPFDAAPLEERAAGDVADMFARLGGLIEEMDAQDAALAETMASLRTAREAADAASVAKSQFLASMSHELRTPLNAIIGYSEILQEEAEADGRETDLKDIERVLNSARQLLHLINDILDLSKIEAGRMDLSCSEFDVRLLIEEAASTTRPAIEKNANTLRLDLTELGSARTDPFKLTQCLLNLLSNAAKFTSGSEIVVEARRDCDCDGVHWIEIRVRDAGIGMSEEQLAGVFNSFRQAEAGTANKYGGTGLGLAITRRLLRLMGGDVWADSQAGIGSTFTLRIPAELSDQDLTEPRAVRASPVDGAGRTVLIIDDEESGRDLAARSLSRLGFSVHLAATGLAGLDAARTLRPSVILLDIKLPDVSGWDVLNDLQAGDTAAIPVIVHSIDDNRRRALSLGACEHLLKPADRDVLAAAALRFVRSPHLHSQSATAPTHASAKTA